MKDKIKSIGKLLILFIIGAFVYMGVEMAYRCYTHWTMGVLGGLCFIIIGGLNESYEWDMPFLKQCVLGSCVITFLELIFGLILNKLLGLAIWDYSNLPFNLFGQISLIFSLAWVILSCVAIVLDDWLRHWLFKEEKPHYKFW